MKFLILSRLAIENLTPISQPHLIISIQIPNDPKSPKLPINEFTLGVLGLKFDDLPDMPADVEKIILLEAKPERPIILFDHVMAKQILDFVKLFLVNRIPKPEIILINCDAGLSRSPAIAAALTSTLFKSSDQKFFEKYLPNSRVYRCIKEEFADEK